MTQQNFYNAPTTDPEAQSRRPCRLCGCRRNRWRQTARRICLLPDWRYFETEMCGICAAEERDRGSFVLTIVTLGVLVFAIGCASTPTHTATAASLPAETCTAVPVGCYARPPVCKLSICFCPARCAAGQWVGRIWERDPAQCRCAS